MGPEERDWIDRAVSRDGMWEPPAQFVDRLALQAVDVLAPRSRRRPAPAGVWLRLRDLVVGVGEDVTLRLEGSLWVLRQYRDLLFGSG